MEMEMDLQGWLVHLMIFVHVFVDLHKTQHNVFFNLTSDGWSKRESKDTNVPIPMFS